MTAEIIAFPLSLDRFVCFFSVLVMSRVKTQQELEQEARDEAMARQLQLEADQAEAQIQQQRAAATYPPQGPPASRAPAGPHAPGQQPYPHNHHQMHDAPLSHQPPRHPGSAMPQLQMPNVRCTFCSAVNTLQPAKLHLQQICGQCQKLLPPLNAAASPRSAPPAPAGGAAGGVGASAADAYRNMASPPPRADAPQPGGAAGDGILQGTVRQVQARCGQCSAINALPIGPREPGSVVSFKCGQCQAVNQVTM